MSEGPSSTVPNTSHYGPMAGWRTHAPSLVRAIWDRSNGRCWYCGKKMDWSKRGWHMDHFIAKVSGGTDDFSNIVPACGSCNLKKGGKTIEEFRMFRRIQLAQWPVNFSVKQINLLLSIGSTIPLPPPPIFYFEWAKHGAS